MEWRDQGVVLSVRKHGENSVILSAFTPEHGLHAGVVRGGTSRKLAPLLQPGSQLDLSWRARLEDHLGSFTVEPVRSRMAAILSDRRALSGLNAISALLLFALPERAPYPGLYQRTQAVLDMLGETDYWPLAYIRWEVALLEDMGFGLDLSECAATGALNDLAYVSPKTGRAVSRTGAGDWASRLLPLPPALLGEAPKDDTEIAEALYTTGYFLEHKLGATLGDTPLPPARERLVRMFSAQA